MSCFCPLRAYRSLNEKTENGKDVIVFNPADIAGKPYVEIELPCNQCLGCRIERSRQWAVRCVHEASLFRANCFITVTFAPEYLHESGSLIKRDFVLFMKRLRKRFHGLEYVPASGDECPGNCPRDPDIDGPCPGCYCRAPIRFFHCGEYGSQLGRPHHHACLFNFDFPDKVLWSEREHVRLYRSKALEDLWPYGFCTVGDVTFESAAYCARYITKKIGGKAAQGHYRKFDEVTGEVWAVEPEYITMSRRPGIGKRWFDKFAGDVFPKDYVTVNGRKCKSPKYYNGLYDLSEPDRFKEVKRKRMLAAKEHAANNTVERLRVRHRVLEMKHRLLVRRMENGCEDV